jgi:uncharacterized protein (DUF3820 family)
MPVDQWKKEADRIQYGRHRDYAPQKKRRKRKHTDVEKRRLQNMNTILWFGKYQGFTVQQVRDRDRSYLRWLADSEPLEDAWRLQTLQAFLKTLT